MTPLRRPEGRRWRAYRALVLASKGDTCHLCGHGGARQLDHVISFLERPDLGWDYANLEPCHGTRNRCPVCHRCCNQARVAGPKRPQAADAPVRPELSLVTRSPRRSEVTAASSQDASSDGSAPPAAPAPEPPRRSRNW